jgi:hypothetical protein
MQTSWAVGLVVAGAILMPRAAYGQGGDVGLEDPVIPLPLSSSRPQEGGPFIAMEFLFWRQTMPLHDQVIAVRGVLDQDGSISQALGGPNTPGMFFGSRDAALTTGQVSGPGTYEPGFRLTGGWLLRDGIEVEINWIHLFDAKYTASAGVDNPFGRNGPLLVNTFLTAFVFNAPPEFSGPAQKVSLGNPGATFGIWDAATVMSEYFIQRFEQVEVSARLPLYQDDCNRCYWLLGPRFDWIWERFKWRTVAFDVNTGTSSADNTALYSNVVSNRLYGVHMGVGYEWFKGDTPIGAWALSVEAQGSLLLDVVKERAKYERGDRAIASQHARTDYTLCPEADAKINLSWYPMQGMQMRIGYDIMSFFNTVSSPDPVSFNYGTLDPPFRNWTVRVFDGFEAGICFIF